MPVRPDSPAPYAPPAAILNVITKYRDHGLMTPITNDVLLRAGVTDSLVNRTMQALRTLDLIDEAGEPTATLRGLGEAPEAEYKARLADAVRAAYDEVFKFIDPQKATQTQIRDAFRPYVPRGQHGRMVTLFVGLCQEAGIMAEATPAPHRASPRPPSRPAQGKAPIKARRGQWDGLVRKGGVPPALSALLESLPGEGQSWTADRKEDFVHAFGVLLDLFYPVRETGHETDEPKEENGG